MKLFINVDDSEFKKSAGGWQTLIHDIIETIKQQGIVLRHRWRFWFRLWRQSQYQRFCSGPELTWMNMSLQEPLLTSGTEQIAAEWLSFYSNFYFPLAHSYTSCPLAPTKPPSSFKTVSSAVRSMVECTWTEKKDEYFYGSIVK